MPVLKTLKNGVWEAVAGMSGHTHTKDNITDFPSSLPADGGNADTLDGKHANEFVTATELQNLVGDTKVSTQISNAINPLSSEIENKAPAYTYGTADLTAGSSSLETGKLYFVYE